MNLSAILLLAAGLFCVGVYGLLTRRNAIGILLSVELMANAVNINLVAFSANSGSPLGQVFALFTMAVTVAEVVVGLAILILLFRSRGGVLVDAAQELKR
ncbi:MAG: NADH-quinone oxidoreductase subunit NuoK [Myxococcales bacterium]|nr:NADH-quinone oxidoreductase subunit NuoK [Myxococcales bacterium]